jgi:phosphoribosylaminoimidazole (AIR) synthetase
MGTGFVLIVPEDEGLDVIGAATMLGHRAWLAGSVKASPDGKKRVLLPNGMTFTEKDVAVR